MPRRAGMVAAPRTGKVTAPIAQLDRALVYGTRCRTFESSWARQTRPREMRGDRGRRDRCLSATVASMRPRSTALVALCLEGTAVAPVAVRELVAWKQGDL